MEREGGFNAEIMEFNGDFMEIEWGYNILDSIGIHWGYDGIYNQQYDLDMTEFKSFSEYNTLSMYIDDTLTYTYSILDDVDDVGALWQC